MAAGDGLDQPVATVSRAAGVTDPGEQRRLLCLWAERSTRAAPPPAMQGIMRWLGFDYGAAIRRHLEEDPPPPIVALRPIRQRSPVLAALPDRSRG